VPKTEEADVLSDAIMSDEGLRDQKELHGRENTIDVVAGRNKFGVCHCKRLTSLLP
jgi:hypothetical protein